MSHDVHDLLQRTADEPTRPLDTGAVIGKAKRQTRLARAGVGLGAVAILALMSLVALPLVTGNDLELEIADGPEPDQAVDAPIYEGFTLGESYVWRSEPGPPEDAGLAFAAEVLGWDDAAIIERGGAPGDEPAGIVTLVIENTSGRTVELYLEATDTTPQVWEVTQFAAGLEHPISTTEEPSLFWRPREVTTGLHRAFLGATGIAQIRTPKRGTIVVILDATDVANAEISLEGHVDVGDPFCHNIQSTLLLFHDRAGEVVSGIGGRWYGDDPPDCATAPTESEDEERAGARFQEAILSDGEVTFEEYEAAIHASADCVRAKGFAVTVPSEGRAVIHPAVDPDKLLSFDVQIEDHGVSTDDLVLTCQERWSLRVERAWTEQLLPSDEIRQRAMEAAWECGASRGQRQQSPPSTQDAYQAVLEFDCRPWECLGAR